MLETADKQSQYIVHLVQFEGPLDLLLYLVKVNEIDIYDIPIAKITDQYLEYIEMMEDLNINFEADFIIMASTLIYLKSCELLPPSQGEETQEVEDLRAEFTRKLIEYQVFKEAAQNLSKKDKDNIGIFTKPETAIHKILKTDEGEELLDVSLFDMLGALKGILDRLSKERDFKLTQQRYYVEDKIEYIINKLKEADQLSLADLFSLCGNKAEAITFFLAILELTRENIIRCAQKSIFGEIIIIKYSAAEAVREVGNIDREYNG